MKDLTSQVWPVENYTDKIQMAVKMAFKFHSLLSFTLPQLKAAVVKGSTVNGELWLMERNERQDTLLNKIISTTIRRLIQTGDVKKVTSKVSVESQWQSTGRLSETSMINITSDDSVAKTEEAKKACKRRAVNVALLYDLNTPLTINGTIA